MQPETRWHDGLPFLFWRFAVRQLVVSSAPVGGGLGTRSWVLNAQVPAGYGRVDVAVHVAELAAHVDLQGDGVGMLTAADVTDVQFAVDDEVAVWSTVGVKVPTWAAAPEGDRSPAHVAGTINVVALVPVRLSDAALVNAVATATEAKTQALVELGVAGTGTATDAVCVVCPADDSGAGAEPFGGPRSTWGARLARAVHATVRAGVPRSIARFDPSC